MHSYFKAESCTSCPWPAAHKDKQGSPNEGTFSKQNPLHFKSCFQTEKKGDKRVLHARMVKRAHNYEGRGQPPAHSCHCGDSLRRESGGDIQVHTHIHVHTLPYRYSHSHADVFTFTLTHAHKYTHSYVLSYTYTVTHRHTNLNTCTW